MAKSSNLKFSTDDRDALYRAFVEHLPYFWTRTTDQRDNLFEILAVFASQWQREHELMVA